MNWSCDLCSFSNHPDLQFCEICEGVKRNDSLLATISAKEIFKDVEYVDLLDSPHVPSMGLGLIGQCASTSQGLKLTRPEVCANDRQPSGQLLQPITACSYATLGLVELIRQCNDAPTNTGARSKVLNEYIVCSPSCIHASQASKGSFGSAWSCGYRNIQMLCSSLMQIQEYRRVLFDGTGVVPEIGALQRWIETAWKDGFDTEVSQIVQFSTKIVFIVCAVWHMLTRIGYSYSYY